MDHELSTTLAQLEHKIHDLERALGAMGSGQRLPGVQSGRQPDGLTARGDGGAEPRSEMPVSLMATPTNAPSVEPAPAVSAQTPAGEAPSRIVDEQYEPISPPVLVRPPAPAQPAQPETTRLPSAALATPSPEELLRFRQRLVDEASGLTREYDAMLGRLSYAAVTPGGSAISFARGAPSLDIIDVHGLSDAAVRAFESDPGGTTAYGTAVGYPRLRSWIADRHGVEPDCVLVTNGSMQADAFLFEQLVRPGDDVIVERPSYDRTLLSLRERGAQIHPIALTRDGIDTGSLGALLRGGVRAKLAHIIPNFQNPSGYTISLERRETLLALAAEHDFIIFEDDPYVDLRFSGDRLPTMLSMDPDRVVYASSFSKTVCPGVRVGYLVGPRELISSIAQLATNTYISPNMVAQSIVYEFCASGAIERSIETVRAALGERVQTLAAALRRELPEADFTVPQGGYFMWVELPAGTDVRALAQAATDRGVVFVKGTDFLLEGGENTLRLAYSGVTPAQIDEGVARLAAAYRSL